MDLTPEVYISVHTGLPSNENVIATVKLHHPITFTMPDSTKETITAIVLWDDAHPCENENIEEELED